MDYGATSFYPFAMWDENSVYPKVESVCAFKPHMKNFFVETFKHETFNKNSDESAILKTKFYHPADLIIQHLPIKGKVKNNEVNRMRNGYIVDVLTSVDIQEVVKNGGKVIQIYEGVFYRDFQHVAF